MFTPYLLKKKKKYIYICKMDKLLVHLYLLFEVKFITWPIGTGQANWWMKMVLRSSLIDIFFCPPSMFYFLDDRSPWKLSSNKHGCWKTRIVILFCFTQNEMWCKIKLILCPLNIYKVYQLHKKESGELNVQSNSYLHQNELHYLGKWLIVLLVNIKKHLYVSKEHTAK